MRNFIIQYAHSIKSYMQALGKWGWTVIVSGISAGTGIITDVSNYSFIIPYWGWYIIALIFLLIAPFWAFHKIRIERDALVERAKPKLKIKETREENGGAYYCSRSG